MNTLTYRTGVDFKILNKLNTLMRVAKELQVNDLEVSMLEHFLHHFHEYLDYRIVEACIGYNEAEFTVNKFECKNNKKYKYHYDERRNRLMTNLPFFSGRYGLNSNCLLIETGKNIKKLLEGNKINFL